MYVPLSPEEVHVRTTVPRGGTCTYYCPPRRTDADLAGAHGCILNAQQSRFRATSVAIVGYDAGRFDLAGRSLSTAEVLMYSTRQLTRTFLQGRNVLATDVVLK